MTYEQYTGADIFDFEGTINEYFAERGIADVNLDVWCNRNDPDNDYSYDLDIDWDEDDDRYSFTMHDAQRFTDEELFDMWVKDREEQHASYLKWLAENKANIA